MRSILLLPFLVVFAKANFDPQEIPYLFKEFKVYFVLFLIKVFPETFFLILGKIQQKL
jgi:hypothetical protein